ncbi:MAG TPA: histidine phosphatase family protein [Bryobacteraceae bacterium]|nr:histidine phosphatase family protein [Bryobacteraceae bacterium]
MEIYILRHGIAEEAKAGEPDAERALTDTGREKLHAVLEQAHEAGAKPALILTSPYRRALQTARIAGHVLGCNKIVETDALAPHSTPKAVWEAICAHRRLDAVLLAGHEPLLGMTVGYLLGAPALRVDLKKAALVRVDQEHPGGAPHAVLKWMLTPRLV